MTASAPPADDDQAALRVVAAHGGALCTVVEIDGSWSRRLGAQLAVLPDGTCVGSLADGCLEAALARAAMSVAEAAPPAPIEAGDSPVSVSVNGQIELLE